MKNSHYAGRYRIIESPKYKNFLAISVDEDYLEYGSIVFDSFEKADKKAKELRAEKYLEMWGAKW